MHDIYYNLGKRTHTYGGLDWSYSHVGYFTGWALLEQPPIMFLTRQEINFPI